MILTEGSGVYLGVIVGAFFATLWKSWIMFLIFSIIMLMFTIYEIKQDDFRELDEVKE